MHYLYLSTKILFNGFLSLYSTVHYLRSLGDWLRTVSNGLRRLEATQSRSLTGVESTLEGVGRLEAGLSQLLHNQEAILEALGGGKRRNS